MAANDTSSQHRKRALRPSRSRSSIKRSPGRPQEVARTVSAAFQSAAIICADGDLATHRNTSAIGSTSNPFFNLQIKERNRVARRALDRAARKALERAARRIKPICKAGDPKADAEEAEVGIIESSGGFKKMKQMKMPAVRSLYG
ncbi:MAG: hypothetical protein Q9162_006138 [Coniocarpon cinnabarinum]